MRDPLTKEITRRILTNCGIAPIPNFGKTGLTVPELRSQKYLPVRFEDQETINCPIWTGQTEIQGEKIRAICTDLTQDDPEFVLVFRLGDKSIYGLKLIYDDADDGLFLLKEQNQWMPAAMLVKIRALLGMETITTFGLMWQPCDEFEDLYDALSALVDL